MNILILQGSPRANGNTAWMAEEFKKAAEAAGHEVTLVNVAKKKIAGCLACEYCHNKGNGACIQKDDMQELYPLMAEADGRSRGFSSGCAHLLLHALSPDSASHPAHVLREQTSQGEEDGSVDVFLFAKRLT